MHKSLFNCEVWLPQPPQVVFSFFSDARNLEVITPSWLKFQILSEAPIVMQIGTLIDYRINLRGIPLRWQSRIEVWDPPRRFVDVQIRGPYRLWHHEHLFDPWDEGTLCLDRVHYAALGGQILERLFVRRDIKAIFDYRKTKLLELFSVARSRVTDSGFD